MFKPHSVLLARTLILHSKYADLVKLRVLHVLLPRVLRVKLDFLIHLQETVYLSALVKRTLIMIRVQRAISRVKTVLDPTLTNVYRVQPLEFFKKLNVYTNVRKDTILIMPPENAKYVPPKLYYVHLSLFTFSANKDTSLKTLRVFLNALLDIIAKLHPKPAKYATPRV